jgi:hypothetical protein
MPKVRASQKRVAIGAAVGAVLLVSVLALVRLVTFEETSAAATPTPTVAAPRTVAATTPSDSNATADIVPIDTAATKLASTKNAAKPPVKSPSKDFAQKSKLTVVPPVSLPVPSTTTALIPPSDFEPSIKRLVRAIESKDINAVDAAFNGTITAEQHRGFADLFNATKSSALTVRSSDVKPSKVDGTATGRVTITVTYSDPNSFAPRTLPYAYDASWEQQRDGTWVLKSLKTPPPPS